MPPHSPKTRFAAIDVGSHTIRLLISQLSEENTLHMIDVERRITRLARSFGEDETLKPPAIADSMNALLEYRALMASHGAQVAACGATGVVRRARNGTGFIDLIRRTTGLPATILSEADEAFFSAKGVLSALPLVEGPLLIFDLGGSSTEFLLLDPAEPEPLWCTSVFIGAATLTERHLHGDPPGSEAVSQASEAARQVLAPVLKHVKDLLQDASQRISEHPHNGEVPDAPSLTLVGTAGTATTLAAMRLGMTTYVPHRINGLMLPDSWLSETASTLARLPFVARRKLAGLESGREDIILAGTLIVREILKELEQTSLMVSDAGLLEGLLLDLVEQEYNHPRALVTSLRWSSTQQRPSS